MGDHLVAQEVLGDTPAVAVPIPAIEAGGPVDVEGLGLLDGLGAGNLDTPIHAAVHAGLEVVGELHDRAHDPASGRYEAELRYLSGVWVWEVGWFGSVGAHPVGCQLVGVLHPPRIDEGRPLHPERPQNVLLDVLVEGDPGGVLHDVAQHPVPGVVVEEPLPRLVGDLILGAIHVPVEVVDPAPRHAGVPPQAPGDGYGGGRQAGEARGVGEEVVDRYVLPGEPDIEGYVVVDWVIQPESALLGQLHDGQPHEGLSAGSDAVEGVRRSWQAPFEVPRAEALRVYDLVFSHHGDA